MEYPQESHNKEPRKILRHAHQRRDNSPRNRQRRKPEPRCRPLKNDVAWQFEQHVADKIQRQASEVLVPGHAQISC